jgi:hypothetical protein
MARPQLTQDLGVRVRVLGLDETRQVERILWCVDRIL